jgi:hypothetical protein
MITANKHLDLDRSVIWVSALALRKLRKRRVMVHDELFAFLKDKIGDDGDVVLGPALYFLFLVGRLEYHVKTDSFEYVEVGKP